MMKRQACNLRKMSNLNLKYINFIEFKFMWQQVFKRFFQFQFAQTRFDRDFPQTGEAYQTIAILIFD